MARVPVVPSWTPGTPSGLSKTCLEPVDFSARDQDVMGNVYCTKNGVFDGPRNGRKSGNAQNKKHCSLANGRALPNTSAGTPFS